MKIQITVSNKNNMIMILFLICWKVILVETSSSQTQKSKRTLNRMEAPGVADFSLTDHAFDAV
jgi:hypothetical protein